jgi:hypothetical protein
VIALVKYCLLFGRSINRTQANDVQAMYEQKLFSLKGLQDCFEAIAPELIRFPSLNPDVIRSRVENFIKRLEGNPQEGQL